MQSKIAELLHQYFELGVAEGREGRNHDTEAGDAQRVLSEIEAEIAALSAAEPVATVAEMGAGGMRVLMPHPPGSADHLPIGAKLYAAPPAPFPAVKALQAIIERSYNGELGTSKVIDMRNIALSALSAQVQDVARDLPSEFEKWWDDAGHYVGGVVKMTYTQRKQLAWDAFYASANPAAPAKQEGGE